MPEPDGRLVVDITGDQLMAQTCYNMATEVEEEQRKNDKQRRASLGKRKMQNP